MRKSELLGPRVPISRFSAAKTHYLRFSPFHLSEINKTDNFSTHNISRAVILLRVKWHLSLPLTKLEIRHPDNRTYLRPTRAKFPATAFRFWRQRSARIFRKVTTWESWWVRIHLLVRSLRKATALVTLNSFSFKIQFQNSPKFSKIPLLSWWWSVIRCCTWAYNLIFSGGSSGSGADDNRPIGVAEAGGKIRRKTDLAVSRLLRRREWSNQRESQAHLQGNAHQPDRRFRQRYSFVAFTLDI